MCFYDPNLSNMFAETHAENSWYSGDSGQSDALTEWAWQSKVHRRFAM
jgi:hypothetical protein